MTDPLQNRTYLLKRHRLTHQQIDRWLNEKRGEEFLQEKMELMVAVKKFIQLTDLFRDNNIPFISFKGPLLSQRLYGDPAMRFSHDIDLLVEAEIIGRVVQLLFENGYSLTEGSIWPKEKALQELVIGKTHHLSFFNRKSDFCAEIHWTLTNELPVSASRWQEIVAGNVRTMTFSGRTFHVFSMEFELLYLLLHGARHGWNRLKWLVDIKDYPVREVNKQLFCQYVSELRAGRVVAQTNELLLHFFGTQLPFEGAGRIPRYLVDHAHRLINNEIEENYSILDHVRSYRYQWLLFPGYLYKWKVFTGTLFRPGDIPELNSRFKIVFYLYRPFSFIKRRFFHA